MQKQGEGKHMSAKSYESLEKELEQIVARLQSSETSVDEMVALHAKGLGIIDELEKKLSLAKNTVEKLWLDLDKKAG